MPVKISINKKSRTMSLANKRYPLKVAMPNNIMVEVTNVCNLRCKMCNNKYMKRKKGFMSFDLFKRIVNEAVELNIENMGLYTTGESFLHPEIFKFIEYAKKKKIKYVYITTNGQALDAEKIKNIFKSGLDSIKFSIDAGSKEKYEALKTGANWQKLIDVIKEVRATRDKLKSDLIIFASFIVMADNYSDLIKYNEVFGSLVDETNFTFIGNQGSQVDPSNLYPESILRKIKNFNLPKKQWHPCNLLWNRFVVTYEGFLTICCIDFENILIYGDLNGSSLRDCWNNEKMKKFRELHKSGQFEKIPMCFNCDTIKRNENIDVNKAIISLLGLNKKK